MHPKRIALVVSHSNSTSNHNLYLLQEHEREVVSHSNSTSNHNAQVGTAQVFRLFLIPILHQTTTQKQKLLSHFKLFLIPILHQTTTLCSLRIPAAVLFLIPILHQTTTSLNFRPTDLMLFLIPILHQTTTWATIRMMLRGCFSFQFYIKPQPRAWQ